MHPYTKFRHPRPIGFAFMAVKPLAVGALKQKKIKKKKEKIKKKQTGTKLKGRALHWPNVSTLVKFGTIWLMKLAESSLKLSDVLLIFFLQTALFKPLLKKNKNPLEVFILLLVIIIQRDGYPDPMPVSVSLYTAVYTVYTITSILGCPT